VQEEREVVAPTQVPFVAQVRSSPQAEAELQVCPCVPVPDVAHVPLMQSFPGAQGGCVALQTAPAAEVFMH